MHLHLGFSPAQLGGQKGASVGSLLTWEVGVLGMAEAQLPVLLCFSDASLLPVQLLQHLKRIISDLCKLYNLPQHPDVEMLDQPLPAEQVRNPG